MLEFPSDYRPIDQAATFIIGSGYDPASALDELCRRFPDVHSNVLAERVTLARLARGSAQYVDGDWPDESSAY